MKDCCSAQPASVRIDFCNLEFTVKDRSTGAEKHILSGINGSCVPGRLFALMGGSGAGKTTLLDLLACNSSIRASGSSMQGTILVNGAPRVPREFAKQICYVQQRDLLYPSATVCVTTFKTYCTSSVSMHATPNEIPVFNLHASRIISRYRIYIDPPIYLSHN